MAKHVLPRFAGLLLGFATLSGALAQQPTQCEYRGASYLPSQAICLDGVRNECQADGAWVITRDVPCPSDAQPALKSCAVAGDRGAAPGTQRCQLHRLYQCTESGSWVTLSDC